MTYRAIALPAMTAAFLALLTACTPPQSGSTPEPTPAPDPEAVEPGSPAEPSAPLQTYDGSVYSFPIKAQYPETMQVEDGCGGEGCGFFFTFLPQNTALDSAEVHIFLPAGTATAAEQEPFVTGPNGLIENAGWMVDSTTTGPTDQFPYPWVKTVINFSTDREESGHILLGEAEGQAVQVLLLYPAEMASAYWPGANTVLETLEFNPDLLPLSTSSEGGFEGEDPATMCDPAQEPC